MKLAQGTGKIVGKLVSGTKSAPVKTKRKLTAIKTDLSAGYKSATEL